MPPRGVTRGGLGRGGNNHRPKTRAYNAQQPQPLPTPPQEQLPTQPVVVPTPRLDDPALARLEPTPPVVPSAEAFRGMAPKKEETDVGVDRRETKVEERCSAEHEFLGCSVFPIESKGIMDTKSGICSTTSHEGVSQASPDVERKVELLRAETNNLMMRVEEHYQEIMSFRENINVIMADALQDTLRQLRSSDK